jgi:hypothetical protein
VSAITEGDPAILGFDLRFATGSGTFWYSPANFMVLAEIPFRVLGSTGDMSIVDIELFNWESFRFTDRGNVDLPANRQEDGVVIILPPPPPPPPPEITSVCDITETICNPAHVPLAPSFPQLVIIGNNFDCTGGVSFVLSNAMWLLQTIDSCSDNKVVITVVVLVASTTDVTITNDATGFSDTCVGCAESP